MSPTKFWGTACCVFLAYGLYLDAKNHVPLAVKFAKRRHHQRFIKEFQK